MLYPSLWRSCTKLSPATRPDNRSMKGFCFLGLWPLFFSFLQAQADIIYDPWDWVTYRFSQDIASISDGPEHVYFASPGGILRYQTFGRYWDFPITTSQGLSDFTVTAIYYFFLKVLLCDLHRHGYLLRLSHTYAVGIYTARTGLLHGRRREVE